MQNRPTDVRITRIVREHQPLPCFRYGYFSRTGITHDQAGRSVKRADGNFPQFDRASLVGRDHEMLTVRVPCYSPADTAFEMKRSGRLEREHVMREVRHIQTIVQKISCVSECQSPAVRRDGESGVAASQREVVTIRMVTG